MEYKYVDMGSESKSLKELEQELVDLSIANAQMKIASKENQKRIDFIIKDIQEQKKRG